MKQGGGDLLWRVGKECLLERKRALGKVVITIIDNSVLWLHSVHHRHGKVDVNYSMEVVRSYKEPLDRQIVEKVQISNFKGAVLMNRRNEMGGWDVSEWRGPNIDGAA